jgi:O-antigen/teichoic acid export membrane protein
MLFRKAFSITLITQSLTFILGILNTILIVRAIGPQGRGTYSILLTTVSILSVLSSGGVIWSNTYWVGKEKGSLRYILSNALYQAILAFFILLFLAFISPKSILGMVFEGIPRGLIYFSVIIVFFELGILHLNSIFLGLQDFREYNFLSIGRLILFTLFNLLFLYGLRMNVEGVVYSWMISVALTSGAGLVALMKRYHIQNLKTDLSQFLKSLKIGSRALLANILGQLLLRSDLFLINWYLGLKEVGYYSVGVAVAELVLKIPGIAGTILFPKVAADSVGNINLVTMITRLMGIPLVLGVLIFILEGKTILLVAFGKEFISAYNPMIWILLGVLALSYHVILDNYFAGKGYPVVTIWAPGVTLILNIGLNLLLIPKYGISGAAMSTCAAYILLTAIKLFVFRRDNEVTYQDIFILKRFDITGLRAIFHQK